MEIDRIFGEFCAINAAQIEITFNKEVTKETAEDVTNYKLNNVTLQKGATGTITDVAKLSEDKMSVVITPSKTGVLENNKAYSVAVEGVKDVEGKEVEKYVTSFLQNDKTKPTVTEVESISGAAGTKTVTVKFSEPLKTAGVYTIDGVSVSPNALSATDYSKRNEVVLTTATNLVPGKEYTLVVASARDYADNVNVSQTVKFSVVKDTTEGQLVSIAPETETKVKLTFDKKIDKNTIPASLGTNFKVDKVGGNYSGSTVAIDPDDEKSLIVTVGTPGYNNTVKSIDVLITIDGLKDIYGNKIAKVDAAKVTLTKDEVAPKFVNATVSNDNKFIVVEFDKAIANGSVAEADANALKVLNEDSVNVTANIFGTGQRFDKAVISKADGSAVAAGASSSKYIKFYNSSNSSLVKGTYRIQLAKEAFYDTSSAQNKSEALDFNIVVSDLSNKVLPTVPAGAITTVGLAADLSQSITINYNTAMNSTALDLNNYTIDGKALPSGTTTEFTSTTKDIVKITFPKGSFSESKKVDLAIFNVENSAGKALANNEVRDLNVKNSTPVKVTKAVAKGGRVIVTFDKIVTDKTNSATALELRNQNGTLVDTSEGKTVTFTGIAVAGKDLTKHTLTLKADAFKDVTNLGNEKIENIVITDEQVSVPAFAAAQVNANGNASDIQLDFSNDPFLKAEGVVSLDVYAYDSSNAVNKDNASGFTVAQNISINELDANGKVNLSSTITKDSQTGAALSLANGAQPYFTVVAKDANGNVAYSSEVQLGAVLDYTAPTVSNKLTAAGDISSTGTHTLVFSEAIDATSRSAVKSIVDDAFTPNGEATVSSSWGAGNKTLTVTIGGTVDSSTNKVVLAGLTVPAGFTVKDLAGNPSDTLTAGDLQN